MKNRRFYILAIALFLLAVCSSCREELCYDHYPVYDLKFSWELEWERDYGQGHKDAWDPAQHHYEYDQLRPSEPEWVKMVRYFDDGRVSERFFDTKGLRFQVDEHEDCSILFYNGDTEYIILQDVASMHDVCAMATGRTRSGATLLEEIKDLHQPARTTN
ncbi:MAG: hypothetical protein K2N16_06745, partial [Muribaculaceae bacterium]|nr:hypothetical protein [Muribaculaceae bacterium]